MRDRPSSGVAQRPAGVIAYQVLILVVLAAGTTAFVLFAAERHGFFDLNVYQGALKYWVHDGGDLYDWVRPRTEYPFTYPPFAAFAMLPMAFVPWTGAIIGSVVLNVVSAVLVVYWLVAPLARRRGWPVWFCVAVILCLTAAFEPMRETFTFGQVNAALLALVIGDVVLLLSSRSPRVRRFAGIGIGLATAIKLTPGIFILYLLVTRRFRAAAVAAGTAAGATLLAAGIAPDSSRIFWTEALWNTSRVGDLAFISNQSLQGVIARLNPADPSRLAWLIAVVVVLGFWAWRVHRADLMVGVALTGVVGGLVSPVTWIHHLVWMLPAFILLADAGLPAPGRSAREHGPRFALLAVAIGGYAVLSSRLVWNYAHEFGNVAGITFSNAYVWVALILLVVLPAGTNPQGVPDLGKVDGDAAGPFDTEGVPGAVRQ